MMFFGRGKKVKARGASKKVVAKPARKRMSLSLSVFLPVMVLLMAGTCSAGLYQAYQWLGQQPVERVVFAGELRYVDRTALTEQIKPLLLDGFIAVDLAAVQKQIEKTPWIYRAEIERRWPDTLLVHVTEQRSIARWGESGLLNHRGQLFEPAVLDGFKGLPSLAGPSGTETVVMQQFSGLAELLKERQLFLKSLSLNERGSWQAVLHDGVVIELGREQIMERMQRFMVIYQNGLQADFARVKGIDTRYSNGVAVAWKTLETAQTEKDV
jgi:cell division protein FtsQ